MDISPSAGNFSRDDAAILQEVMNIAFGKASADLARVIDIRVVLSVPQVELMRADDLLRRVREETRVCDALSLIEQNFWGKFSGSALLAFPATARKGLVSLFDEEGEEVSPLLEKETLLEVGNILIGACVGKVAELLGEVVSFSPPRLNPHVVISNLGREAVTEQLAGADKIAVLMKTVFRFEDKDISGFLFLVASQDSMEWLETALENFMASF
ncbi:chemotaxis protein CheC [Thiovibrio sp. JS02]